MSHRSPADQDIGGSGSAGCGSFDQFIEDRLAGVLSDSDKLVLDAHFGECPACRSAAAAFDETISVVKSVTRVNPGDEYFANYYDKLNARLESPRTTVAPSAPLSLVDKVGRAVKRSPANSKIVRRFLVAASLIGIGVLVGRLTLSSDVVPPNGSNATAQLDRSEASRQRAYEYLGQSKTLLIGLANFDPQTENPELLNLPKRQKIASELLVKASYLKTELSDTDQHRLEGLIDDLEIILMQIANIEAQSDVPAIEILQDGVDRTGLLFRINVEEMRRDDETTGSKSRQSQSSEGQASKSPATVAL